MKTQTGLTIIHNGNRVEVYTDKELRKLNEKSKFQKYVTSVLSALKINI